MNDPIKTKLNQNKKVASNPPIATGLKNHNRHNHTPRPHPYLLKPLTTPPGPTPYLLKSSLRAEGGQVRAHKAVTLCSNLLQVHISTQLHVLGVDPQNLKTTYKGDNW